MSAHHDYTVIALGGSIVVGNTVQVDYLNRLRNFLISRLENGQKFVLVIGGGAIARDYQSAASKIISLSDADKDWIGIHTTRLNAHLLRTIFYDYAYPVVLDNPAKAIEKRDLDRYALFFASGWRPGFSTDYIAFRLAQRFDTKRVLIATKIPYVYDKDISIYKDAKPYSKLSWGQYTKLISHEWKPGMRAPVDPIAADFAQRNNLSCVLLRGTNLRNLAHYLDGEEFEGTTIGR